MLRESGGWAWTWAAAAVGQPQLKTNATDGNSLLQVLLLWSSGRSACWQIAFPYQVLLAAI